MYLRQRNVRIVEWKLVFEQTDLNISYCLHSHQKFSQNKLWTFLVLSKVVRARIRPKSIHFTVYMYFSGSCWLNFLFSYAPTRFNHLVCMFVYAHNRDWRNDLRRAGVCRKRVRVIEEANSTSRRGDVICFSAEK